MEKSITNRYWKTPEMFIPSESQLLLAGEFRVLPEIIKILERRGISGRDSLRKYLYPTLHDLADPFTMKDMEKACKIIVEAIVNQSDFIIWGDYDVDGVTATCLLLRFFNSIGVYPKWYIPNRFNEGYGLNTHSLNDLIKECPGNNPVLITVDCGATNYNEVKSARDLGCRVIITDHHEPGKEELSADAVLNVKQSGCAFQDKDIAGVGTAFYLAVGVRAYLASTGYFSKTCPVPNLKNLTELVAIGTIADMVPLKNCNRVLVRAGFEVINNRPSPGLAALLEESDVRTGQITSDDIAFQIAPKINAAGRLESASLGVELFLTAEKKEAAKIAKRLTALNKKRKILCSECLESTLDTLDNSIEESHFPVILNVNYSIGILGIVASQLVVKRRVPVTLLTKVGGDDLGAILKGSCRSVQGINLVELLCECSDYLIGYGGHEMAAGISIYEKDLPAFSLAFCNCVKNLMENINIVREEIDIETETEKSLSDEFIQQLQLLEPYGVANSRPIFINYNSILVDIKKIGRLDDHLVLKKRDRFESSKCVAFNLGYLENSLKDKPSFHMIYTVMISRFKQSVTWQANVIDLI